MFAIYLRSLNNSWRTRCLPAFLSCSSEATLSPTPFALLQRLHSCGSSAGSDVGSRIEACLQPLMFVTALRQGSAGPSSHSAHENCDTFASVASLCS